MSEQKRKIDLYENTNQILNAEIDKITVEIIRKKKEEKKSQTVLLTGCSPIAGTTSVSISLGIAMAATKRKTILVDCDVRKSTEYKKLNDEVVKGLADYLSDEAAKGVSVDEITYDTNIDGLSYVPCGDYSEHPTRILCSEKMVKLIEELESRYDCIIFDFPSIDIVPDAQTLFGTVDGIIYVAALGETRKKQIVEARRKIKPYQDRYYGMIMNKVPMDLFKQRVRNYAYYLKNKKGNQSLSDSEAIKKYNKNKKNKKQETKA